MKERISFFSKPLMVLFLALMLALSGCDKLSTKKKKTSDDKTNRKPKQVEKTISSPDVSSPEAVVRNAFKAALMTDAEAGFKEYLKCCVYSAFGTSPNSINHRKKFEWPRLRKQVLNYVKSKTDLTFVITRRAVSGNGVRLFIKWRDGKGSPKPVALKKDAKRKNQWRIVSTSL